MAWEIVTKQEVADVHPINLDNMPDIWSETVEALIRQHMSSPNLGKPASVTEIHDGNGTNMLSVHAPPIQSVTSLTIQTVVVTSDEYVVYPNYIKLKDMNFVEGTLNVEITYMSGNTVVDPTVKLAAIAMIAAIANYKGTHGADSSLKWSQVDDQQAGEATPNRNIGLTSHLTRIMKRILRRERVRAQ